jgi:hypothetical protein
MRVGRFVLISGAVVAVLLVAGIVTAAVVLADEGDPGSENHFGWLGHRTLGSGFGAQMLGFRSGDWTAYDTAAEELGLTPEGLFAELHAGKSLDEIAEAEGVDLQAVYDAMSDAARAGQEESMREAIAEALADGSISQEEADWLLDGLEQGFLPRMQGLRPGSRWGGRWPGGRRSGDCSGLEGSE